MIVERVQAKAKSTDVRVVFTESIDFRLSILIWIFLVMEKH
jgi:hypothetical protein